VTTGGKARAWKLREEFRGGREKRPDREGLGLAKGRDSKTAAYDFESGKVYDRGTPYRQEGKFRISPQLQKNLKRNEDVDQKNLGFGRRNELMEIIEDTDSKRGHNLNAGLRK